jgi:hypothetical protein
LPQKSVTDAAAAQQEIPHCNIKLKRERRRLPAPDAAAKPASVEQEDDAVEI